jgi:membrane protein CcdC involved in cytochrome C biogenesis
MAQEKSSKIHSTAKHTLLSDIVISTGYFSFSPPLLFIAVENLLLPKIIYIMEEQNKEPEVT